MRLATMIQRAAATACLAFVFASASAGADDTPQGVGFDFYVLALSWSPSYCAAEGDDANRQQCGGDPDHAFVVHGLWPQFEHGYPGHCPTREPDRVPDSLVQRYLDIMPSAGLIGHQWRKHGSCSGLSQSDYLAVTRAARERVIVPDAYRDVDAPLRLDPDAVEDAFVAANPGLPEDGIAVTCGGRFLREVRICLTRALDFRPCAEVDRKACHADSTLMPPT